jgi:citrate lyase beta subunit
LSFAPDIDERLRAANKVFDARFPGEPAGRQPIHVVYGGAHLFKHDLAQNLPPGIDIYGRVIEKLKREPVEDLRLDFEDGYGVRSSAEEDGHAISAAAEVAKGLVANTLPPFIGIRIKPFTEALRERGMRTLEMFLTALGPLPPNFVVTYPKAVMPQQVTALADIFDDLEARLRLPSGALKMELMIETTQSIPVLLDLLHAARGRCVAAHFGTYDYTASCGITAAHQHMLHPACDYARNAMQVAYAGTGIRLSDGATNILPVGQAADAVHRAWKLHYDHIRHSLACGFYQGWDLHPAQLPTRYAAVYAFFREGLTESTERLRNFMAKSEQATLVGTVFDDAATGLGLINYFNRALHCGAIRREETPLIPG